MIDYQVFIDFQHPEMIRVPVVQGDTESRRITFVMYNGSAEYNPQTDLDTTLTVALSYLKPDGTGGQYDTMPDGETPAGNLSGNVCVLRLAPQTMSAAGLVLCNLVLFDTQGVTLQTFPFVLDVKRSAGMEITSQDYYNVQTIEGVSQSLMHMVQSVNNATPDQHGNVSLLPWQLPYNGVIGGQQVGDVEEALDMLARMQAEIISQEIKDALVNALSHVAWTDEHGQDYVDALEQAMRTKLVSISAVFNPGEYDIFDNAELSDLRQFLTVSALYSDNTTRVVDNYTLSGTLAGGESVVTVSYGGKSTTFTVTTISTSLPSGYTKYGYIEKKTTTAETKPVGSFIWLNNQTDMNVLSLECMIQNKPSVAIASAGVFGARLPNGTAYESYAVYMGSNTTGYFVACVARNYYPNCYVDTIERKMRVVVENPPESPYTVKVNGATIRDAAWTESPVIPCGFVLFNNIPNGSTGNFNVNQSARIGNIILRTYTGECVGYYIPCVYSGKIGMYDLISQTFYTAATAAAVTISNSGCVYAVGNW